MNVYENLTIISDKPENDKVLCRCKCGTEKWINIYNIKRGDIKSCGCLKKEKMRIEATKRFTGKSPANFKDKTGERIGLCKVMHRIDKGTEETWYCLRCDCGTEFESTLSTIRRATYKDCRCGNQRHRLKSLLRNIIDRCTNEKSTSYKWYGLKGITVFEEWTIFPIKFIDWSMKNGWKPGLTIDRIDSKKGYYPENCRWITKSENSKKSAEERWARKDSV